MVPMRACTRHLSFLQRGQAHVRGFASATFFGLLLVGLLAGCGSGGGEPGPTPSGTSPSGTSTAPTISTATPQDGTVGAAYSFIYDTTGSTPITFSVTSGALPNGLSLSASGVISGTPTQAGAYTGTVTASNGTQPDATQNFSITMTLTPPTPRANNATPLVYVANSGGADASDNDPAANTVTSDV